MSDSTRDSAVCGGADAQTCTILLLLLLMVVVVLLLK
jgi:hypothetical protein